MLPGQRHDYRVCHVLTLGSQEGEGAVTVATDRLGRFFDLVYAIDTEYPQGQIAECRHGVWSVSDPGLMLVFLSGRVMHIVIFVLDAPVLA